jgi:transcriptional regulator with XRE-family HTH domain
VPKGAKEDAESIGERLRRLRLDQGLSQRQLAGKGISAAYVSRIEAGTRQPSLKAIRLLAQKLGVSPDYLETGRSLARMHETELRLADAELALRLSDEVESTEPTFRAVLAEAEEAGDPHLAARARLGLGLAAFRRGDHREAVQALERARDSSAFNPVSQPDLFATLGRAYVSSGQSYRAVELLRTALAELEERAPDDSAAHIRFSTYLSYALSDMGQLEEAQEVLGAAFARSPQLLDSYSRVRLHWAQARLAAAQEAPHAALAHLRHAIALLEALDDERHLARAHLLSAEILTLQDEPAAARSHLETATNLLGEHPDAEDAYWLRAEQARLAARSGDPEGAVVRAREALELIGDTDPAERGTACWALGEGLFALGAVDEGNEALARAVDLLAGERLWHEAAAACRSWAKLLRTTGREDAAFEVLERATLLAARSAPARAGGGAVLTKEAG